MTKLHLKNWRDERGSELDRAKSLIKDKNNSLPEISKITKIPVQSLRNYRGNIYKLDKASWKRINRLAQLYDIEEVSGSISQDDLILVQKEIHNIFAKSSQNASIPDQVIIKQMEQIITSDPLAVLKIFKAVANLT